MFKVFSKKLRLFNSRIKIASFSESKSHTSNSISGTISSLSCRDGDKNPTFFSLSSRVRINTYHLINHSRNIEFSSQWFILFKQIVSYFLTNNYHFFIVINIRMIQESTLYYRSILNELVIRMNSFYSIISGFFFID